MRKSSSLRRRTIVLLASTAAVLPTAAYAQEGPADGDIAESEIVVTAQRREERLRDVPISITALGSAKLEEANVKSFDDYAKLLPSVSFQSFGPSQSQIFFRGVSSGGDGLHIGPLPTSSMYIDEIPVTTIAGTVDFHIYDISRVEALAGPQGTLFGASALSGVLRVITNAPKYGVTEGSVDLQLNKWGKGDAGGTIEGMFNFPLGDSAALRVVGFYDKVGGYIDNIPGTRTFTLNDGPFPAGEPSTNVTVNNSALVENDYNDVETWGGRAALKIDLDDDWTATTQFIYQNQVANGGFLYDPTKGDLKVTDYLPSRNKDRWWQAALTIQGKLSDWDISYSGGYFRRKVDNTSDYSYYSVAYDTYTYEYEGTTYNGYATYFPDGDGGFLDPTQRQILNDKYTKLTQELRVSSPSDKSLRLTAGLFLQHQTNTIRADYEIPGIAGVIANQIWFYDFNNDVPFDVHGNSDSVFRTRIHRKDRDYAVFAQAEVDLAPTITLIGGIRGFIAHNTIYGFSGFNGGRTLEACIAGLTAAEVPCVNVDKKQVESGVIWRGGLRFKPSDDLMVYATVSRGYRPGGNNRRPLVNPFTSDTLDNYEIGWKTRLNGNIYFNGAVFHEKWKDVQFGLVPIGNNGITNTYNAGDARIYGIEGDVTARFGGLTLSAGATYVDAKTTTDLCEVNDVGNIVCLPNVPPAAPAGTRLPIMPKFKGNLTARYTMPVAGGTGFIQGSVSHQGGTRTYLRDDEFTAVGPTRAFTTADFSAGINWDSWRFEAFLQNAFDKRGELSRNTFCAASFCGQYARTYPTQPRLFGVKVGYDF